MRPYDTLSGIKITARALPRTITTRFSIFLLQTLTFTSRQALSCQTPYSLHNMHLSHSLASILAAGSLTTALALPVEPQNNRIYKRTYDHDFGSRSVLVVFGVVGVVVLALIVWAVVAHRNGRRPFACFGGCGGRKTDVEAAERGSMGSDIPLTGAGRHYDRRPVSVQPQQMPLPAPQRPEPVQYQVPRRPVSAEWARGF